MVTMSKLCSIDDAIMFNINKHLPISQCHYITSTLPFHTTDIIITCDNRKLGDRVVVWYIYTHKIPMYTPDAPQHSPNFDIKICITRFFFSLHFKHKNLL
jgi:hypothetical protein